MSFLLYSFDGNNSSLRLTYKIFLLLEHKVSLVFSCKERISEAHKRAVS